MSIFSGLKMLKCRFGRLPAGNKWRQPAGRHSASGGSEPLPPLGQHGGALILHTFSVYVLFTQTQSPAGVTCGALCIEGWESI